MRQEERDGGGLHRRHGGEVVGRSGEEGQDGGGEGRSDGGEGIAVIVISVVVDDGCSTLAVIVIGAARIAVGSLSFVFRLLGFVHHAAIGYRRRNDDISILLRIVCRALSLLVLGHDVVWFSMVEVCW